MYHPSRNGIYCDLCGKEVLVENSIIEYYTINMKKVICTNGANDVDEFLDMDFCEECCRKLKERVHKISLINDEKRKKYGRNNI